MSTPVRKNVGPKRVGPPEQKPEPRWVRCLVLAVPRPQFFSPDPSSVRVCGECRKRLSQFGRAGFENPTAAPQ